MTKPTFRGSAFVCVFCNSFLDRCSVKRTEPWAATISQTVVATNAPNLELQRSHRPLQSGAYSFFLRDSRLRSNACCHSASMTSANSRRSFRIPSASVSSAMEATASISNPGTLRRLK